MFSFTHRLRLSTWITSCKSPPTLGYRSTRPGKSTDRSPHAVVFSISSSPRWVSWTACIRRRWSSFLGSSILHFWGRSAPANDLCHIRRVIIVVLSYLYYYCISIAHGNETLSIRRTYCEQDNIHTHIEISAVLHSSPVTNNSLSSINVYWWIQVV